MRTALTTDEWRSDDTDALFDAILTLSDRDDAERFFRDLCTLRELEEITARWAVVRLLVRGIPYRQIHDETGVSTATITRINQWLQHGTGGYTRALEKLGLSEETP
ncbi:MAG: helix-turn-helix domain-containing protein [Acidimicrobiia bacterium]|nr:helix-turn-helix domain-containing protein [Acidimicrobiia bacterium]MBT8214037.1 helix-turn-helix domain-containing protein [Acidimicrobiia bacterium]